MWYGESLISPRRSRGNNNGKSLDVQDALMSLLCNRNGVVFSRRRLTLRIKYSRGKKHRLTTVNNFSEKEQQVDYQFPLIYSVNRC